MKGDFLERRKMSEYISVNEYNDATKNAKLFCELETEMTDSQLGFLCGLIRDNHPKKIVEVGVAAGGTTLVLLQCLKELELNACFYSVDLNKNLYNNTCKETGYVAKQIERNGDFKSINHRYFLGGYLPEVLSEIGRDIDFLILDTVHQLPGEILDFLAALPYLSNGAIVVLHDVALQHADEVSDHYCFATQVLFSCVKGQKFLNNRNAYPNIAAFQVNQGTFNYIYDVFSALSLTWKNIPSEREIDIYRLWYKKHYDEKACVMFEQAFDMNKKTISKMSIEINDYMETLCDSVLDRYESVYLYGAGKRGKSFLKALNNFVDEKKLKSCKFVISNANEAKKNNYVAWEQLVNDTNSLIILTAKSDEIKEKLRNSKKHWLIIPESIWAEIERIYEN